MFEFFWRLKDSSQLEHYDGTFTNPRQPKIEQVVGENLKLTANKISEDISKALDTRLNELNDTSKDIKDEIKTGQDNMSRSIDRIIDQICTRLTEIGENMPGSRNRR